MGLKPFTQQLRFTLVYDAFGSHCMRWPAAVTVLAVLLAARTVRRWPVAVTLLAVRTARVHLFS